MRTSLLSATLLLALSACGSSSDGGSTVGDDEPVGADASGAPNQLDVCKWLPKEVADLILGGAAHDPRLDSGNATTGACGWGGAADFDQMVVAVNRNGASAAFFVKVCAAVEAPSLDNRGIGVAACGREHADGGATLQIQLDASTTILTLFSNVGTLDQAFEVLRGVATRIPSP